MIIETNWLIHVCVEEDQSPEAEYEIGDDAFVEIADVGINDADEIRIRGNEHTLRFHDSKCARASIWTRRGIEMLHEATGEYLRRVKEREQ